MIVSQPPAPSAMDLLCPMHLCLAGDGRITHVGPTLRKVRPDAVWLEESFFDAMRVTRPHHILGMQDLEMWLGRKFCLEPRDAPGPSLTAIAVPCGDGFVVNTAFGISTLDAIEAFKLTHADFAPTDPTIEMLYVVEAKSAAMSASERLNHHLRGAKRAAELEAETDSLTGLKNRRALEAYLSNQIASGTPITLMQFDLDRFKAVNDTLGHAAGDHVLRHVGATLSDIFRKSDFVARLGGDEFIVVLGGPPRSANLDTIAQRVLDTIAQPIPYQGHDCQIGVSIGTLEWQDSAQEARMTATDLLARVDLALYASKRAGRGRNTYFSPALTRS